MVRRGPKPSLNRLSVQGDAEVGTSARRSCGLLCAVPALLPKFGALDRCASATIADVFSDRLEVRLPRESDRSRFVDLFCDHDFMIFSAGALDEHAGHQRFDEMLVRAAEIPFAKQPVIERSSGTIVGYAGVNTFLFDGEPRLEFGWRLTPDARGRGYATEATTAVLDLAKNTYEGEILAMIDPDNVPSQNVARKVGFRFWKEAIIDGYLDRLYRLRVPGDLTP